MGAYGDEQVLVIKRELLDAMGDFHGFRGDPGAYLDAFLAEGNNFYLPRDAAEEDPSHKQIIPYAIFHHRGRFLHYVRGGSSGEQRLASKGSIGIGGHINTTDAGASGLARDAYLQGVAREVEEELNVSSSYSQRVVGLLNDDSNAVGRVHLGVVHLFDLESGGITANEDAITELEFLSIGELRDRADRLETWSAILVENLGSIL
jgi:predicted NUDIX family phosphoesterase